jgi:hypothetical protein
MAERRSCSAKPRFLFRQFSAMHSFALSLFTIASGALVATPSRAITIEVVSPSAEVDSPSDNSIYNIYPRASVYVVGAGKASATLKVKYEGGDTSNIFINQLSKFFLDDNVTTIDNEVKFAKTEDRYLPETPVLGLILGLGDHTAKMDYALSTFNFQVDPNNPRLFHSMPPGPNPPVPVTLLTISDVHKFRIISNPVPGPLPLLGVGAAFGYSRKLRKRIKTSKTPEVLSAIG